MDEMILLWPAGLVFAILLIFAFEGVKCVLKVRRPAPWQPTVRGPYGCADDASMRDWANAMAELENVMVADMDKLQWKDGA